MTYTEVYKMVKRACLNKKAQDWSKVTSPSTIKGRLAYQQNERAKRENETLRQHNQKLFNQANTEQLNNRNIKSQNGNEALDYYNAVAPNKQYTANPSFTQKVFYYPSLDYSKYNESSYSKDVAGTVRNRIRPLLLQKIYKALPDDVRSTQMSAIKKYVDAVGQRNLKIFLHNNAPENRGPYNPNRIDQTKIPYPKMDGIQDKRVQEALGQITPFITQNTNFRRFSDIG